MWAELSRHHHAHMPVAILGLDLALVIAAVWVFVLWWQER
jgi:hypothetical protein